MYMYLKEADLRQSPSMQSHSRLYITNTDG
jgi:hypothetical protein